MKNQTWWRIIVVLLLVIVALLAILIAAPKPAQAPTTATSTVTVATSTSEQPLHARVVVTSPVANAKVGQTFTVTGQAPGNWYNEAVFPIQVIGRGVDNDPLVIGHGQAQAQSDWMTTDQVPFIATVTLENTYHGAATLVLLKDNESGLPQNDDSLEVPIVIQ